MADGTLVFDTRVDTTGVNNAEKTVTGSLKRIKSKLKAAFGMDIADKAAKKVTSMQKRYDDATAAVERQKAKVQELQAEIEKLQAQNSTGGSAIPEEAKPLYAQADELAAKIEEAKAKACEYSEQWKQGLGGADTEQMNWLEKASRLEAEYDAVLVKIEKIEQKTKSDSSSVNNVKKVEKLKHQLTDAQAKLSQLSGTAATAKTNLNSALDEKKTKHFSKSMKDARKSTERFTKRLKELAKSALIFSVITKALTGLRELFGSMVGSNKEFNESWGTIKGNLLTAFQPIYEVCIPALNSLMKILENITAKLASFSAALFGKSVSQMQLNAKGLYNQAKATKAAGDAAQKASRSLAGFDEINQLNANDRDSSASKAEPSFNSSLSELDSTTAKIASYGTLLLGTALLIIGICTVNIPAILIGIGLIASGLYAGSKTGAFEETPVWLKQVITWGSILVGVALIIAGICIVNIPMIISGVALMGVGIGYGASSGAFKEAETAVIKFLKSIQTSQLIGIAILLLGIMTLNVFAIFMGLSLLSADKTQGKDSNAYDDISAFLDKVKNKLTQWGGDIKAWWDEDIAPVFTKKYWLEKADSVKQGITEKYTEIKTWYNTNVAPKFTKDYWLNKFNSIKQGFTGKCNEIKDWFNTNISPKFTKKYWTDKFSSMKEGARATINGIIACFERGINNIVTRINRLSWNIPDWVPAVGGQRFGFNISTVSLPRLASGMVVPANYGEFEAILGDNRREVEVVSPLSTIKQALREVQGENGNGGAPMVIYLMVKDKVIGEAAIEYHNGVVARTGVTPLKGV